MDYQIQELPATVDRDELRKRIERLLHFDAPRYRRLWLYYRNPLLPGSAAIETQGSDRPYRQAQEWGLPSRITGVTHSSIESLQSQPVEGVARKEVVIENDIAWRIDTLVDYLFGKPLVINSCAAEPARRRRIEMLIRAILMHNGGITFLQQIAMLGAIYGFVDVLVKLQEPPPRPFPSGPGEGVGDDPSSDGAGPSAGPDERIGSHPPQAETASCAEDEPAQTSRPHSALDDSIPAGASTDSHDADLSRIARTVRFEIVEPARALPLLCPTDWRTVDAYVQCYTVPVKSAPLRVAAKRGTLQKILDRFAATRRGALLDSDNSTLVIDILTPTHWQRYEDEKLVGHGANSLGILPLVHIQNSAVPFEYSGGSDVEPLIPIQDELNTRLCDRAHRVTMQSFKMYLGKGIEGFTNLPVAPGRMWMTDNEQAEVIEFGGDAGCASEERHIIELREAMDKTSSVTPIAAGAIKGRIGRLTSGAALRVTLMALLAKTERKRITYGEAIVKMCELALMWLDRAGTFPTAPDERRVEIHWPNPLPVNEIERLEEARLKQQLGVPSDVVLRELGY